MVPPQFLAATVSERGVGADECVLSVRWSEAVISCGGSVSQYVLSVTPPTSDCPSGQCVNTTDTQYDLTVTLDQAYNLTVRAVDSCGNNGTSDLVQIVLRKCRVSEYILFYVSIWIYIYKYWPCSPLWGINELTLKITHKAKIG